MAYCTQQNLIDRYSEDELILLTDRTGLNKIDTAAIAAAIADADSEIDSYLSARYTTPVAVVSDALIMHACNIARYRLHGQAVTELVQNRYKEAVNWLKDVAAGKAGLPGASGPVAVSSNTVSFSSSTAIFDRSSFE